MTLEEEKAADEKLTAIAQAGINHEAAVGAHPQMDGEADGERRSATSTRKRTSRKSSPRKSVTYTR
jgi:hypothetical protein